MLHARSPLARTTLLVVLSIAIMLMPRTAAAGTYWVDLYASRGEIGHGVNGFSFIAHGGSWNAYGNRCQAEPGKYVAGAYCKLRFTTPPGLTAGAIGNGGIAHGKYRGTNDYVMLRVERPGGNPSHVTDSDTDGDFSRGWGTLGAFLDIGVRFSQIGTVTASSNWFQVDHFTLPLHDPSAPVIQHVQAGGGGWNGPGCLPHSYSWADSGSQVASISITNLTTGAAVDSWGTPAAGVTTGYPVATDTGCTPAPGTGAYAYRTTAYDRSGNGNSYDYTLHFDATAPTVGQPTLDGAALADGAVIGSAHGYRPAVQWTGVGDAHSGLASIVTSIDGAAVPHVRSGATVTLAPSQHLTVGSHALRITVTDAVGNASAVSRTIVVRDDVNPAITVASPEAGGESEPVLDVSVVDDFTGIDPSTWTVKVNGVTLVASSAHHRLQANIGYLVDGTHEILVTVADRAGNVGRAEISYQADSGDGLPDAPGLTGLYVLSAPSAVLEGSTHHVRAIAVKAGRPVAGRVELRAGPLVLDSDDIAPSGAIDLNPMITVPGPLTLHPPAGSGLEPVEISYAFTPTPTPTPTPEPEEPAPGPQPAPAPQPNPAPSPDPGPATPTPPASGGTTTNNTTNNVTNGVAPDPDSAAGRLGPNGSYPRNVVYYVGKVPFWNGVPLGESGAPLDRVAPAWRMSLKQQKPGTVRRTRRITLKLWTSEMAVLQLRPTGSVRRITMSPRRKTRTIQVAIAARTKLAKRLALARPGSIVVVRLRVVATDKNENRSFPRVLTFRVRA